MIDLPSAVLGVTLLAYWSGVGVTALVNRWRHGRSAGIWPSNRVERALWPIWVPLIGLWNVLPWLALSRGPNGSALRLAAALLGVGCFVATVVCWARLGRNWSMAVVPGQRTQLVQTGPYALVRHPIYALSIALMLCSVVVVPTLPMLGVAALHVPLLWTKARSEEQFLHTMHGGQYAEYCRRTGRFFPVGRWKKPKERQTAGSATHETTGNAPSAARLRMS